MKTLLRCKSCQSYNYSVHYINYKSYQRQIWRVRYQFQSQSRLFSTEKLQKNEYEQNKSQTEHKQRADIPSISDSANVIIKAPLIFFCVAFGAVVLLQGRQGMESGKLPEQYQWFKRYISSNSTIMDELGVPIKITGGSTNIDIIKDEN